MAQTAKHMGIVHPILSRHEADEVFDNEVRRLMDGMSGEEFIRRWEVGEFEKIVDKPGSRHIMRLVLMMPGGDHKS